MPAARTGILAENRYDDPRMWGDRHQEFALGSFGTGVAVGDYDGDRLPDLFVVSKTGSCRLFRNLGDWRFEDTTARAGLDTKAGWSGRLKGWLGAKEAADSVELWKQGAVFVDVNNDGRLDLYVCRFGAPNWLFINQGDGTFTEEAAARGLAIADASGVGAFCDYDLDGWLDVYVQTSMLDAARRPGGQPDFLFRNNGDGTFTDVSAQAGIAGDALAHAATWWDVDGDQWPDLYVSNDFGPPDILYRNNRDGTFTDIVQQTVPHMTYSSMGADLGDVNNDGRLDLIVAEMAATTHEMDQRGAATSRELSRDDTGARAPQVLHNVLFLNTGTGRCLEVARLAGIAATDWTWSVRLEDLDNDGRLDLHVTNGMVREFQNVDLRDRIVLADNPVSRMNIIRESPVFAERHLAFRNRGDLTFEDVSDAWGLAQRGVSFGAAFGDFDADGDLDLVYANYDANVTVLRNTGTDGHRVVFSLRGTRSNRFGVGATVRLETPDGPQVRQLVVARGYLSGSEATLHFGLGTTRTITRATITWPSGAVQQFEGLTADRHYTVTEPAAAAPSPPGPPPPPPLLADITAAAGLDCSVREGTATPRTAQPLLPWGFDRRGPALAAADLDRDGRTDLVLGGTTEEPARVLLAGSAGFGRPASPFGAAGPADDGPLLVFDADADGNEDVLITRSGANLPANAPGYQPRLFLGDGRGGFRPAPADALPALALSAGAAAAADFDRDGRLDVFIGARNLPGRYPLAPRSCLLVNRGGRFEDVTEAAAPGLREVGLVTSALWSDADADGWPDLLVALEWGGVRCFRNNGDATFTDASDRLGFAAAGTGWWTSLASADFNGDRRPDFVAGNVGLNTPYRASPAEPALAYYGDFGGNAGPTLIEARHAEGKIRPWRTSRVLGAQVPAIKKRFPRNNDYAAAALEEIVGADRLARARRFAATEFRSGVFLSQEDGRYRFAPLPQLAQVAPLQGVVAGDFDGDGRADICAVQNSFAPIPSIGRFGGGLGVWLRGDGRGGFAAVWPAESGLLVDGDAKALAVLDVDRDGGPDFVGTRNNGPVVALRTQVPAGSAFLRVDLAGPAGNATGVGARVTALSPDGSSQTAEITAGGGYYSQSGAACFFGYREGQRPRELRVVWPDGRQSTHAVPASGASVRLAPPR